VRNTDNQNKDQPGCSRTTAFLFRCQLGSVLALERLKALFELEQPVQGVAARFHVESPHGPTVVDLQEFNQSFSLGDVRADPFTWTHPETVLEVIQVLVDHFEFTLDPNQDSSPVRER
jgi:hypothetical protein